MSELSKKQISTIDSFEKVALQRINLIAECHYKEEQLEHIAKEILGMDSNDDSIHLVDYKGDGLVIMFCKEQSHMPLGMRISEFIKKVRNGADKSTLMKEAFL